MGNTTQEMPAYGYGEEASIDDLVQEAEQSLDPDEEQKLLRYHGIDAIQEALTRFSDAIIALPGTEKMPYQGSEIAKDIITRQRLLRLNTGERQYEIVPIVLEIHYTLDGSAYAKLQYKGFQATGTTPMPEGARREDYVIAQESVFPAGVDEVGGFPIPEPRELITRELLDGELLITGLYEHEETQEPQIVIDMFTYFSPPTSGK